MFEMLSCKQIDTVEREVDLQATLVCLSVYLSDLERTQMTEKRGICEQDHPRKVPSTMIKGHTPIQQVYCKYFLRKIPREYGEPGPQSC